ncbi:MAG: T9SS type A sorting domain-containing protein, partial [Bacteroidota bacterium]
LWRNPANGINGRAGIFFDGVNDYLSKALTGSVVSGAQKSVFAAFKTRNTDVADGAVQVIYKHGNHENGLSIVLIGTSNATESIRMTLYDNVGGTQRAVSRTFNNVAQDAIYVAQMFFDGSSTTQRVGMSLDNDAGQVDEQVWTDAGFGVTSLTAPALPDNNTNISMGGRQGYVRFSDVLPGTNGATSAADYNNGAGVTNFFGGAESRIGEVLVYNTAAKSTRDAIYCYMRNKYLTTSSVNNNLKDGPSDEEVIAGEFNDFADDVDVYPNPAESDLMVSVMARSSGTLKVDLVDALGRVVKTLFNDRVSENFVLPISTDVSNLANGTYVVRVTGAGELNMSKSFIVRH